MCTFSTASNGWGGCFTWQPPKWKILFFFFSLNPLIGWQISIGNCCKPFFSLLYNYKLLCFWRLTFKYCSRSLPTAFIPDIAPLRVFTTNSLCFSVCPLHEWRVCFKISKIIFIFSPFEKHHSLFYPSILFLRHKKILTKLIHLSLWIK